MAYLPVVPAVRDAANEYLAGMAARGFVPPPIADVVRHFERVTPRPTQEEITPCASI